MTANPSAAEAELQDLADQYRSIAGTLDRFDAYWTGKAEAYSRVADDLDACLKRLRAAA